MKSTRPSGKPSSAPSALRFGPRSSLRVKRQLSGIAHARRTEQAIAEAYHRWAESQMAMYLGHSSSVKAEHGTKASPRASWLESFLSIWRGLRNRL